MISLTVALPMYRAKHIAWVAMESLVAQRGIDFEWELIIAEEVNELSFGSNLRKYRKGLAAAGCKRIEYIPVRKWIPLSEKWRLIAASASNTSKGYILQAADCYSQPNRLKTSMRLFLGGADWVQSKHHLFYDMLTGHTYAMYREKHMQFMRHPCAADMAVSTSLIKAVPCGNRARSVDGWMYRQCQNIKGTKLRVGWDLSNDWKLSINVHGMNNISDRGRWWKRPYMSPDDSLLKGIRPSILRRLRKMKRHVRTWKLSDRVGKE